MLTMPRKTFYYVGLNNKTQSRKINQTVMEIHVLEKWGSIWGQYAGT